jgi:hypothetical protein
VTKALRGEFDNPDLRMEDRWAEYTLAGTTYVEKIGENSVPVGAENVTYAYQQQAESTWQAKSSIPDGPVNVSWVDWGDNLEAVDWYTKSKVRVETVLFLDLGSPMVEYQMKHLGGLGKDEMWGVVEAAGQPGVPMEVTYGDVAPQATVYSNAARLTIQKLNVERDDPALESLTWNEDTTQWEGADLVNAPLFSGTVSEGGDGPGYYSAEINVKGKVIYGYNWDVRDPSFNEGPGDYRLTFSLDTSYEGLNTFFTDGITEILVPAEEELLIAAAEDDDGGESPTGGGTAQLNFEHNLTYIDVRIKDRGQGRPVVTSSMGKGGILNLVGDEGDNHVVISTAGNMLMLGGEDTTISGPTEFAKGTIKGLNVKLGAGNDSIRIGGEDHTAQPAVATAEAHEEAHEEEPRLTFTGNVTIDLGAGDDAMNVSFTNFEGWLQVFGRRGNDAVDIGRGSGYAGEDHAEGHVPSVPGGPGEHEPGEDTEVGAKGPPADVFVATCAKVSMGPGDDAVKVGFTEMSGKLTINTGAGEDRVVVGRGPMFRDTHEHETETVQLAVATALTVPEGELFTAQHPEGGSGGEESGHGDGGPPPDVRLGSLWINTGPQDDAVKVAFAAILHRLDIRTGGGDDYVITGRGPIFGVHGPGPGGDQGQGGGPERRPVDLRVGGNMYVNPGAGTDMVVLRNAEVAGGVKVVDKYGIAQIATQNLDVGAEATFETGKFKDNVALLDSYFARGLSVTTAAGADSILMKGTTVDDQLLVSTGSGHDQLVKESCTLRGSVTADMGHGNDKLAARDNIFTGLGTLDGGRGRDTLYAGPEDAADELMKSIRQRRFGQADEAFPHGEALQEVEDMFGAFLPGKP